MVKHSSPYHPTFRRLVTAWLALFVLAQFIAPVHGWLEATPNAIHHDGFNWSTMPAIPHGCGQGTEPVPCRDDNACQNDNTCQDDNASHSNNAHHDGNTCKDKASCCDDGCSDDEACNDDDCGSCCHHQPIQSALHGQEADGAVTVIRGITPPVHDILPGIHPRPFLPPRSLS